MKSVVASILLLSLISQSAFAQEDSAWTDENIRPAAIGLSFVLNDFTTAQRIRNGSLEGVLRDDQWARFAEMSPGFAITYFKGLRRHIDFAGTLGTSFVRYPFPNKPTLSEDALLLEADASVNVKMFSEAYWFTPYLSAGLGASKFKNYYGAFLPLGAGVKVNFFDEAAVFINTSYRVPVSPETTNYHFTYSIGVAGVIGGKRK